MNSVDIEIPEETGVNDFSEYHRFDEEDNYISDHSKE